MDKQEFCELKLELLKYLAKCGYSHASMCDFSRKINGIPISYFENEQFDLDNDVLTPYIKMLNEKAEKQEISRATLNTCKRICRFLLSFYRFGSVSFDPAQRVTLMPQYTEIINRMLNNENWNSSRKKNCKYFWSAFFLWLQRNDIRDLNELCQSEIKRYIQECANRMTNRSIALIRYYTRLLFEFLFEQGYIENDLTGVFSFVVHVEHNVYKPIPQHEMALVLNSINTKTAIGKRDYAIIITALTTGLRASDIVNLKRHNFDWKNGFLKITQVKTGKEICLPLTRDYGNAIADYLLNGRPNSTSDFIFLSTNPPFNVLNSSSLRGILTTYRTRCNLPHCPFHSIRRTLGTGMVVGGVGIDLVPDVLGQSSIDSTRPYIIADTSTMRECSLSLKGIPEFEEDDRYE